MTRTVLAGRALALPLCCVLAACSGSMSGSAGDNRSTNNGAGGSQGGPKDPDSPNTPVGVEVDVEDPTEFVPVAVGAEFDCKADTQDPGPYQVRRLTRPEYVNAVRDALGISADMVHDLLPNDLRGEGFNNAAITQLGTLEHVEAYAAAAEKIAEDGIDTLQGFVDDADACDSFETGCLEAFVQQAGQRLFRRPLGGGETDAFVALLDQAQQEGLDFNAAGRFAIEAMLQSPQFLYRIETQTGGSGGARDLNSYEMATRLAFLLTNAPPDQELLQAAADDRLDDTQELMSQVQRLLATERAQQTSARYAAEWLETFRLGNFEWGDDMAAESLALFADVVWQAEAPVTTMFDSQRTFVSSDLAEHYGLSPNGAGVQSYTLNDVPERIGLLSQGTVATSGGTSASSVGRGLFILENMLCSHVSPPPPGVSDTPPEVAAGQSQRHHADERIANRVCGSCHGQFEPLAFGLGQLDGTGRFVEEDELGNPLQTDGTLVTPYNLDGTPYETLQEYAELMASNQRVGDCMMLKMAQFAMGRLIDQADACTLAAVQSAMPEEGARYQDFMQHLATQPAFRSIRTE